MPTPSRPPLSAPILLALTALVIGCGGGATEPTPFGGHYALRTSNGAPLPVPLLAGWPATIDAGALDVPGTDSLIVTLGAGGRYAYPYQRVGDSLVVVGWAGFGGRVSGNTVRLRVALPLPPSWGMFGVAWHDLTFARLNSRAPG